jgi:Prophage antirepressor
MKELTKIFNYGNQQVRTVFQDGDTWFVAIDACRVLGIRNTTDTLSRLDSDELTRFNLGSRHGTVNIVNEFGLYNLILGSRKPEAKKFKRWVTHEVLPSIRKTGAYQIAEAPKPKPKNMCVDIPNNVEIQEAIINIQNKATCLSGVLTVYNRYIDPEAEKGYLKMIENIGSDIWRLAWELKNIKINLVEKPL